MLKVAFKHFVKNSIEAVSMQQIADASKVGVASVFRCYANKTDLGVAKHLNSQYHPKPLEIICYHCQLSAEKAIKG